ncbi:stage 0 sporulation protein B (sporulation initiation phosphotransferase) [Ureibacillus xyleni]|uniref:Stage 0 sporulation protein B (Sporulation initiation phosphotransferase) n=1 Tax=Ureibacillus xyleni TaxID=614648 RepID=A0A285S5D2_9BACL|nr:Spo0B domain-containing protein [Ureibacillus xyleni]SOC02510.1 stage 0 sporulation protein B (sporulation initiation phosphotransferase) [Ureibacillus xyleni]
MKIHTLSNSEVIRFANHDFMNHLQLIKMYLELDKVEDAKKAIENISESCKTLSNINKLKLPKTVEWLQTFQWRFPSIEYTLKSLVEHPVNMKKDEQIVEYLEKTVIHVYDHLDPYTEQQLLIEIESNENDFKLMFDLRGNWEAQLFTQQELPNMKVQTYEQTNQHWKYVLSLEQE